jgi:hypothetical protein
MGLLSINGPEGICKLCETFGTLRMSHILPKALYRHLRFSGGSDPVSVTRNSVHQSSKQEKAYLLCSLCENRLNHNGENWMLSHGYRGRGRFRLRDALVRAAPWGQMDDGFAYAASSVPELDVKRIAYYASSVFWRASLCPSHEREHQITLGTRYEKEFRDFLMGRSAFPSSAALMVQVSNSETPLQAFSFPFSQRHDRYYQHSFFAQGVLFWLFVGARLPPQFDRICIVKSREQLIFLSDKVEESVQTGSIDLLAEALGKRRG